MSLRTFECNRGSTILILVITFDAKLKTSSSGLILWSNLIWHGLHEKFGWSTSIPIGFWRQLYWHIEWLDLWRSIEGMSLTLLCRQEQILWTPCFWISHFPHLLGGWLLFWLAETFWETEKLGREKAWCYRYISFYFFTNGQVVHRANSTPDNPAPGPSHDRW